MYLISGSPADQAFTKTAGQIPLTFPSVK